MKEFYAVLWRYDGYSGACGIVALVETGAEAEAICEAMRSHQSKEFAIDGPIRVGELRPKRDLEWWPKPPQKEEA